MLARLSVYDEISADMSIAVITPVSEYLETSYRPDREYIDGEILERNLGELDHGRMQMLLSRFLSNREGKWGIFVVPELENA
jgi:hypothetical protein